MERQEKMNLAVVLAIVVVVSIILMVMKRDKRRIQWASGWRPLIGHALAYKKNPVEFIASQSSSYFRVNLAGKRMIIIGRDPELQKEACNISESILSARLAVASIGFTETLGEVNIKYGTDFHRATIKESGATIHNVDSAIRAALTEGKDLELFNVVRQAMLRAVTQSWLGDFSSKFLKEFMQFQDALEDATAKAAVLPRFIALPLVLWPVMRMRKSLENKLISETLLSPDKPWPIAFNKQNLDANTAATLVLGLLFAAHKNPAIAAANAFLFLKDSARALNDNLFLEAGILETLRLTAHSIGAVRECRVDSVRIGKDLVLRKGDCLAMAHAAICTDKEIWGQDAHLFKPERWFVQNNGSIMIDEKNPVIYNVFSNGIHRCPGRRIALDMIKQATHTLLDLYCQGRLQLPEQIPDLSFERATLAQRAAPIVLRLIPTTLKS